MAVGTALGIAGLAMQGGGMYSQYQNSKYNAEVAKKAGEAQSESISAEARRLADEQREIKAQQRVIVSAGGAGAGQEQPLMLLADQANKMNLDQLEMGRQAKIAKDFGSQQSLLAQMQGRAGMLQSGAQMLGTGYNLYQSRKDSQSTGDV